MLKVMIVDDEPFIAMGLSALIDWKEEGYEIVKIASNGKEAYDYVMANDVDVIIADIQMPVMTGLDLLKAIREADKNDIFFIILSGYSDFKFAQIAMEYNCSNYILKPVREEELLKILRNVSEKQEKKDIQEQNNKQMQEMYLNRSLLELVHGKSDEEELNYINSNIECFKDCGEVRYLHIRPLDIMSAEEMGDESKKKNWNEVYEKCKSFFYDDQGCCLKDISGHEGEDAVGVIYSETMIKKYGNDEGDFLQKLQEYVNTITNMPLVFLVGKKVEDISKIYRSYSTACILQSYQGFRGQKNIYFYEQEVQNDIPDGVMLCTDSLEKLIGSIGRNEKEEIEKSVDALFEEMERIGISEKSIAVNTNYLLFRLIHLAVEQDETVNQEEVMVYIEENSFESGIKRGSKAHFNKFAMEYAEYLVQLRKNVSRGVLSEIERDIKENYAQNLSLRGLSQKYFVNASYLGQVFRKKYGQSFKDYLCAYRIDRAIDELLRTDKKVKEIAEEVGYKDVDYFVSKFIARTGCTPAKYRRQNDMEG